MSGHGGNLRKFAELAGTNENEILDFSANINPIGPPSWLRSVISRNVENLVNYPDPECLKLREAISIAWGINLQNVIVGNGEDELIFAPFQELWNPKLSALRHTLTTSKLLSRQKWKS